MFELTFVCDSGNLLTDPCTKLPVVIVGRNFPEKIDINKVKMRQIQYKTISGIGVMSVISPKEIRVFVHGKWQKVNAVIGINENIGEAMAGADGIIPTRLIENL